MRLSRIHVENFRNFQLLELTVGRNPVILGENKVGKSNLIHALRLVLDPSLPDTARDLRLEDLWDGFGGVLTADTRIVIWVEITDFEAHVGQLAVLNEHLIESAPMTARLTYVWRAKAGLDGLPTKDADFEWSIFGGSREDNLVGYELRKSLPMDVLPALRDCESDLARWARSPLRPLLDKAAAEIDQDVLESLAKQVDDATTAVHETEQIKSVTTAMNQKLLDMVGSRQVLETILRFSPSDPDRLVRALKVYIDEGKRGIADASVGSANILYLALKALEYEQLVAEGQREHTFLTIEEPEAHLHPQLQRLVFRHYLRPRLSNLPELPAATVLLTTHSPHVASVTPLESFVVLRRNAVGNATAGASTASLGLSAKVVADLERYLDATRAELLFANGVLLVEGEAERFVVPVLARKLGIDLDELGITICAIAGTAFAPYLRLVGPLGLNMPYAVLTDRDRRIEEREGGNVIVDAGYARYRKAWRTALRNEALETTVPGSIRADAAANGVFFNNSTFEVALFKGGFEAEFNKAASELTPNKAIRKRFEGWASDPSTVDPAQLLKDIDAISKGRFAQRLSTIIDETDVDPALCPSYVHEGLKYVADQCT
jgi:putative ATP-dependent endonuclease of the OLD family